VDLTKTLDSYELTCEPMRGEDVPRLHELSIAVNWPHRPHDWELLLSLGHGFVARDEIGRILGSAMWFPIGPTIANVGMVITSPRLQDNGAGRWLMGHVLRATVGRTRILNATKAAYRLYLSLDFTPTGTVYQHQGVLGDLPDGPDDAVPLEDAHHDALLSMDARAYGGDRHAVLTRLLTLSQGVVLERAGQLAGFALCRPFGRGHVIGPVVAASEQDCIALIRPLMAGHAGDFLRMDTREKDGALRAFLAAAGLRSYDQVTTMALGAPPVSGPERVFGLVNQALG